jgi:hypothetical protein
MPNWKRYALVAALALAALGVAQIPWLPSRRPADDGAREVARIRHHLEGAEAQLLSRDISGFTPARRVARARMVAALRAYRERGLFPHNHRILDVRTPVFIDEHGTRCAMAWLIERSGGAALVARIARTRNLARIRDLAGDPDLAAWLDRNGLTVAEAARIQPEYGGTPGGSDETSTGTWVAAGLGAGVGTAGIALNLRRGTTTSEINTRGLFGVGCGLLGAGLGVPALDEGGWAAALGAVDLGLGLVSFGFGLRQLHAAPGTRSSAAHEITPIAWRDRAGTRRFALVMQF